MQKFFVGNSFLVLEALIVPLLLDFERTEMPGKLTSVVFNPRFSAGEAIGFTICENVSWKQ